MSINSQKVPNCHFEPSAFRHPESRRRRDKLREGSRSPAFLKKSLDSRPKALRE